MIDLAVFDLDGTLVDSRRDLADAANAMVAGLGGTPLGEDAIAAMVGEGARVLVSRVLAAAGLDPRTPSAFEQFLEHYDARLTAHTRPYPGIPEVLADLRSRLRLSVLTNKPMLATDRLLAMLGLAGFFDGVVGGDTSCGRKPDPAGLLHLINDAGTAADRTVLVGDSAIDLETARRAGTRIVLARYGFGYRFTGREFRGDEGFVDSPSELPGAIARASSKNNH